MRGTFAKYLWIWSGAYVAIGICLLHSTVLADTDYTVENANRYIQENKHTVNQTYRLKYHAMAPIGWINDPNGFIYFRNEYHLFYQYNPYSTVPNKIHWGHSKSRDLLQWEDVGVALAPDQTYDQDGVFSGSAIEKDGKMYLMYTCVHGDSQLQCIAVSEDGIHFNKIPENPVIDTTSLPSNAQPQDFRDPKVFKRGDLYYVVLASKTKEGTGQILLYQSSDLISWTFKSILLEGTAAQGIMWECPDLYELDGKDVLVLSPILMPRVGNDFENFDSVIEFIGRVDWEQGKFAVESLKEIDHGLDFYATQSLLDVQGRRIVIAWMNMWNRTFPTHELGHKWSGAMTLPRELHIRDGALVQKPISEITNHYKSNVELRDIRVVDETKTLDVSGEVAAIEVVLDLSRAKLFWIELRVRGNEKTVLSYEVNTEEVKLDRRDSGYDIKGGEPTTLYYRKVRVPLQGGKIRLHIFLDQSSVEVFVNGGTETLTTTIYPLNEVSDGIKIGATENATVELLKFSAIA